MYRTECPLQHSLLVPENIEEDCPSFSVTETDLAVQSYLEHGFAVLRDVIPKAQCQAVLDRLERDIKPYNGLLPRIGGKEEVNKFNENGFLMNTLSNVQESRIVPKKLNGYLTAALDVLTHRNLAAFRDSILKTAATLITWNQFEGNPVTIPHHDSFFWAQDLKIGEVIGTWVALEDIHPGAGRLYVYPGTHRPDFRDFAKAAGHPDGVLNVAEPSYRNLVVEYLKSAPMECKAPCLKAGDVLVWDSRTIHGSLVTSEPQYSRSSFTAHFGSITGRFAPCPGQRRKMLNGVSVKFPTASVKEALRSKFPKAFQLAKSLVR